MCFYHYIYYEMINANKGMYIEQLMNRTIQYYQTNNIAHLEKRQIPIKILKHINKQIVIAKLIDKAKVDYFLYINKKYVEIECKQTKKDHFDLSLIKNHQAKYLNEIKKIDGVGLLIVYFELFDRTIGIFYEELKKLIQKNKQKKIKYSLLRRHGILIELIFPGILNLKKLF